MSLFGNSTGNRSASKNLVEFRAGKMYMKGRMVHPDKRKGMLSVYQSDDSLMHFCWKDRTKGTTDDDLIIFPDDVEFKHVTQCTTGRVYLLKFKSTSRKMFFWMQEPKTDKDEENCRKVNDFLNNPPTPGSSRGGGGGGALGGLPQELANLGGDSDLQSLLGNLSQQQLMQLLGGVGMGGVGGLSSLVGGRPGSAQSDSTPPSRVQSSPGPRGSGSGSSETPQPARPVTAAALPSQTGGSGTTTTTTTPTTTTTTTPAAGGNSSGGGSGGGGKPSIQLSDLQTILSGMGGIGASGGGEEKEGVDLGTAITPEAMLPILANAEVQERLIPFLPEGETLPKTEAELKNTVQSPQFQQAMNSFSAALASGQLGPLMGQFELGDDVAAAATQGDVEAFAKAMQGALAKKKEEEDAEMKDESKDNE